MASAVMQDVAASRDLPRQRAQTGLGSLLRAPMPLCGAVNESLPERQLAVHMLPYQGGYAGYHAAVKSSHASMYLYGRAPAVVIQGGGSGKTRLAYADGMGDSRLIVIARVWHHGRQAFSPAWAAFVELLSKWQRLVDSANDDDRLPCSACAVAALRLLVACHVRVVVELLVRLRSRLAEAVPGDSAAAVDSIGATSGGIAAAARAVAADEHLTLQEAALRALDSDAGDAAVAALFASKLQELGCEPLAQTRGAADEAGADRAVSRGSAAESAGAASAGFSAKATDSASPASSFRPFLLLSLASKSGAVDAFAAETDTLLRRLLAPGTDVVLWWDEVDALAGTGLAFLPPALGYFPNSPHIDELHDCLSALAAVCNSLRRKHGWMQTFCGRRMELHRELSHGRFSGHVDSSDVTSVTTWPTSLICEDEMLATLRHFFVLDDATVEDVQPLLAQLRGRPAFFFSDFLPQLWNELLTARAANAAELLRGALLRAGMAGVQAAQARMTAIIECMWPIHSSIGAAAAAAASAVAAADSAAAAAADSTAAAAADSAAVPSHEQPSSLLCIELFVALLLHGGKVTLNPAGVTVALRSGLLVLPLPANLSECWPDATSIHTDLLREPALVHALAAVGWARVLASKDDPDRDPVFRFLATLAERHGLRRVCNFTLSTSIKDSVLRMAVAWCILRGAKLCGAAEQLDSAGAGGGRGSASTSSSAWSLAALVHLMAADGFAVPARMAAFDVLVGAGLNCEVQRKDALMRRPVRTGTEPQAESASAGAAAASAAASTGASDWAAASPAVGAFAPIGAAADGAGSRREAAMSSEARAAPAMSDLRFLCSTEHTRAVDGTLELSARQRPLLIQVEHAAGAHAAFMCSPSTPPSIAAAGGGQAVVLISIPDPVFETCLSEAVFAATAALQYTAIMADAGHDSSAGPSGVTSAAHTSSLVAPSAAASASGDDTRSASSAELDQAVRPYVPGDSRAVALRRAFATLANSEPGRLFLGADTAFRMVVSPTGYDPAAVSLCNELNVGPCAGSPILLCGVTERAFGSRLAMALKAADAAKTVPPLALGRYYERNGARSLPAFLLPRSVDDVSAKLDI